MAKDLKGTKTHENLKDAFAGESQANRRYLYFAKVADIEGYPEIAGNFRETAEGETGHAHGHLDYLKQVGDPATGLPIGDTAQEPQGVGRRRDPRVHRHVPGHGEDRARGGLRRDRRLVRDARQGREVARRPLPEDARHASARRAARAAGGPGRARRPRRARRSAARPRRRHHEHDTDKPISYQPTDGLSYDPEEPKYWDAARARSRRSRASSRSATAAACASSTATASRRCSTSSTRSTTATSRGSTRAETDRVMDACFQCKLCEVQCPYTPRDKHEFQLDFPKLVHRYKAQRAKAARHPAARPRARRPRRGRRAWRALSFGIANVMNRVRAAPRGSWRRRSASTATSCCPTSRRTTFERWAERQRAHRGASPTAARPCSSRPATCRTTSRRSAATRSRCSTATR